LFYIGPKPRRRCNGGDAGSEDPPVPRRVPGVIAPRLIRHRDTPACLGVDSIVEEGFTLQLVCDA
jgi:hypothetical protein